MNAINDALAPLAIVEMRADRRDQRRDPLAQRRGGPGARLLLQHREQEELAEICRSTNTPSTATTAQNW